MTTQRLSTMLAVPAVITALVGISYTLFQQQRSLQAVISQVQQTHERPEKQVSMPVEKLVSKSEIWRPIQERVKDTVVQVFSQVAEFDFLEPYKTPTQYSTYGSAFFINENGELLSNAHVVNQAKVVWIQIPSLGKRDLDVEVVGVSPERDVALLRLTPESLEIVRKELGAVPYLPLGDSDQVRRSDEVLALGYPLGQQSLKSTSGVISGREGTLIQMSAAINPGNSGGPLLNAQGEVVGINSMNVPGAQNVGYIIPIKDIENIYPDLRSVKLLRKPFLGVLFNNATETLTELLGNPQPGGCYVVEVVKNSTLYKAGVERGDMIYSINGHTLDVYGEMSVPWSEDKISLLDYVSRLSIGQKLDLVIYRRSKRKEFSVAFSQSELPAIRKVYPGYEIIDYEIFGGMVVMQLTLNHVIGLAKSVPGLASYAEMKNQTDPVLIVTHIFPSSQLYRSRAISAGSTINEVNGLKVGTLDEFRAAIKKPVEGKFLTIRASDNLSRASDNVFVALPHNQLVTEAPKLAKDYHFVLSTSVKDMCKKAQVMA
ncbi:MAG: S1C family serine protease [Candidatus Babeliales bacterium]